MTFAELYTAHAHDSCARRLLAHYRDAMGVIEQSAKRIRAEGHGRWADALECNAASVLQQAEQHMRDIDTAIDTTSAEQRP